MKIVSLSLILFLFVSPSDEVTEKMQWSESRKLTWADFQGVPNASDSYVASTNSGISFSYSVGNREGKYSFNYTVLSNFYPKESWYRPESASEYILKHEQTHFDISELHARILRKKLESVEPSADVKEVVDALYAETEKARRAMQQDYDRESDHSKVREGEYKWRNFVAQELQKYDRWKLR